MWIYAFQTPSNSRMPSRWQSPNQRSRLTRQIFDRPDFRGPRTLMASNKNKEKRWLQPLFLIHLPPPFPKASWEKTKVARCKHKLFRSLPVGRRRMRNSEINLFPKQKAATDPKREMGIRERRIKSRCLLSFDWDLQLGLGSLPPALVNNYEKSQLSGSIPWNLSTSKNFHSFERNLHSSSACDPRDGRFQIQEYPLKIAKCVRIPSREASNVGDLVPLEKKQTLEIAFF